MKLAASNNYNRGDSTLLIIPSTLSCYNHFVPSGVIIGMSGGVDSSVAAALLVEKGYSVTGVMIRLWHDSGLKNERRITNNLEHAKAAAKKLGIPFYIIDESKKFKDEIVDPFLINYLSGETPNPCVLCNPIIKWGILMENMRRFGADYVATGHYARLKPIRNGKFQLLRAVDDTKDQSYVLTLLNQELLRHTLFPLGNRSKNEIRFIASKLGFKNVHNQESQDLCFLGQTDYRSFIKRHAPQGLVEGNIINSEGAVIGKHQGLAFYTIGQRKGLGIYAERPMYVIKKDITGNALIVGYKEDLGNQELIAGPVNWILGTPPSLKFRAHVKIRYKAALASAYIQLKEGGNVEVYFNEPVPNITPGQYAVFYDGDVVLGGGKIKAIGIKQLNSRN